MRQLVTKTPKAHLQQGNKFRKKGEISEAIKHYKLALEINEDFIPAHVKLAETYESQQQFNPSIIHREKVVTLQPQKALRLAELARNKQNLDKISEAIADYEQSLSLSGEKPIWIYQELGKLLQKTHQFEKAVTIYRQAIERKETAELYYQLGKSHQKWGQTQEAIKAYKISVKKPNFNPRCYCDLGDLELKLGHFEVAKTAYEKAIELKPGNPFFHLKLSRFFEKKREINQAIENCLAALEINPNYDSAINHLASLYEKIDDVQQAVTQLQQLIQRQPNNSNIQVKLGKLLARQEKWDEAVSIYQAVLQLDSKNVAAYLALADLFTSLGKIDAAITHLEQAIAVEPQASQKPYDNLKSLHIQKADLETVTTRYKAEAAQNPQHPGCQMKLGDLLCQQGELNQGIEHYQTAKELGLVQPWVLIRRKQALFEAGRLDDAEAELQQLVQQYPDKPTGLEQLAKLATQLYKFEQALEYWEQVNQQFPQHIWGYAARANTLIELERIDQAKAQFQQLADQHRDQPHGFEGLAKVAAHVQDWDSALNYWKVCIQKWPDKPSLHVGYGRVLMQLEKFTEAEEVFKTLQENFPESHYGLEGLAKVARVSGQVELALEYSRQLTERFPELGVGYSETVENLIELGKFEAATQAFLAKPGAKNIERKREKPRQFPSDLVLPERVGINNDYTFIEQKVKEFVASGKPYSLPVSIIIPVYNRQSILAKTLAAITHQTYPKELIEVVVVDDGSSDAVDQVIRKYENHLELVYTRQADRGYRAAAARNLGMRAARHDYLITLDCDILPYPELVEAYMKFFHVTEQAILIGHRRYVCSDFISDDLILEDVNTALDLPTINPNNEIVDRQTNTGQSYDWRFPIYVKTNYKKEQQWPFHGFASGNVGYSRKAIERAGDYDEDFQNWGREDNELAYRFYNAGYYFIPVMDAMSLHQEPPEGRNETDRDAGLEITRPLFEQKCPAPLYRQSQPGELYEVPKVSIYIPAYNGEKYIKEAIDSALNQTYTDLEVCICDDGSTDGTLKVLEQNYQNHPRVRWVSQANGGIGKASNTAVRICRGMYIGQLDSDDLLKPNAVELAVHYLDHHDVGCVYSDYEVIDGNGDFIRPASNSLAFSREALLTGMIVSHFRMFRKRDWMRTTGFAEDLVNAVDYDMHLKLSEVCDFYHLPSSNYCYRFHGENTSIENKKHQQINHFVVINRALERMGLADQWEAIRARIDQPTQVFIRRKIQQKQLDSETQELLKIYQKRIDLQPNKPQTCL